MNIIEAMQKLKLGKTINRKSHRLPEKTYGIKHDRPISIIEETEKGQWVENPKTLDTLRGQTTKHILSGSELASADGNLSYPKLKKFLTKNREKLNLIYTPEQLKIFDDALEITRKRNFVDTFGRAKGSNTQSETTLMNNLFNTGLDMSIKKGLTSYIPGASALYSSIKSGLNNIGKVKKDEIISNALLDPTLAKELLLRPDIAPWYQRLGKDYYKPLQTSIILGATRDK